MVAKFCVSSEITSFNKVSTLKFFMLIIEPQPELVLKLFLNSGKSDPRCSYKRKCVLCTVHEQELEFSVTDPSLCCSV